MDNNLSTFEPNQFLISSMIASRFDPAIVGFFYENPNLVQVVGLTNIRKLNDVLGTMSQYNTSHIRAKNDARPYGCLEYLGMEIGHRFYLFWQKTEDAYQQYSLMYRHERANFVLPRDIQVTLGLRYLYDFRLLYAKKSGEKVKDELAIDMLNQFFTMLDKYFVSEYAIACVNWAVKDLNIKFDIDDVPSYNAIVSRYSEVHWK